MIRTDANTFELRIDSIAAGGDGVGRRDGMVVFVPRTAPADRVLVSAERHDRLMRGRVIELLEPSPERVEPPCRHYVIDHCGGCQLQHLGYEAQLDAKSGIIRDTMARIGRVAIDKPVVEPSDRPWRYRRKLTLAMRRADGRWIAGLHRYDAPDVFPLEDCLITDERILAVWSSLLRQQDLFPAANELRGAVRLLSSGFSFMLEGGHAWTTHAELFAAIADLAELWWKPEEKSRRLLQSRSVEHSGTGASFAQVNPDVAAELSDWVVSLASRHDPKLAVDAYAGTGDFAVALAGRGVRVIAIEIDRDAARVAASRLPDGSRVIAAPVEKALRDALPADVVILNPPRAGVDERVTRLLKPRASVHADACAPGRELKALIYVSCNPATLARDVRRLENYRVQSMRAFDMFPQTAHVETVCELVPAA